MERVSQIFAECDIIKQIVLFSDKCSLKEVEKMEEDFEKDLKTAKTTRIALGKYLKNTEKLLEKNDKDETANEDNQSQQENPKSKKKKEEVI